MTEIDGPAVACRAVSVSARASGGRILLEVSGETDLLLELLIDLGRTASDSQELANRWDL
jgi:hypothetical protein